MKKHKLKVDLYLWQSLVNGTKTAEVRKNDRDFAVGDILILYPYGKGIKACRTFLERKITHIVHGPNYGIQEGYSLLSFNEIVKGEK